MELTGKQRRHLRALAHHIDAVVITGNSGVSEAVVEKVIEELKNHELIKVKVNDGPLKAKAAAPILAEKTESALVQVIGKTVVLYRRRKKKPAIELPKA